LTEVRLMHRARRTRALGLHFGEFPLGDPSPVTIRIESDGARVSRYLIVRFFSVVAFGNTVCYVSVSGARMALAGFAVYLPRPIPHPPLRDSNPPPSSWLMPQKTRRAGPFFLSGPTGTARVVGRRFLRPGPADWPCSGIMRPTSADRRARRGSQFVDGILLSIGYRPGRRRGTARSVRRSSWPEAYAAERVFC